MGKGKREMEVLMKENLVFCYSYFLSVAILTKHILKYKTSK